MKERLQKKQPVPKQELRLIHVVAVVEQRPKRSQKQNMTMKSMSKLRQSVHPKVSAIMSVKIVEEQLQDIKLQRKIILQRSVIRKKQHVKQKDTQEILTVVFVIRK